jgi:SAM-dependent methyltransferase
VEPPWLFDDATARFSRRVANYVLYRPGYPAAMVAHFAGVTSLTAASMIADIGSGTGLLAQAFLEAGFTVTGVEPNREMREAGVQQLAAYPCFAPVEGVADATSLPSSRYDLVMAGQAFHWFDPIPTRAEWVRILKPDGIAALIWNERNLDSPFMREAEEVVNKYASTFDADGVIREGGRGRIGRFFEPASFQLDEFRNRQVFGLEGLVGRVASCSYTPGENDPGYSEMVADLERIFQRHQDGGLVNYEYITKAYWGRLSSS